jgi:hypothetical protein
MSFAGNAGYDGGLSQISLTTSYQELDQSSTDLRNREQTVRRNLTAASLHWNTALAGKTSLGTGAQFERTGYPKGGYVDNNVWSVPADLYYSLTAKTDLSAGFSYRRTTTEADSNNSKDLFFNLGARGQFTPKLSGQVRAGITSRRQDKGGTDRLLGLAMNLDYAVTPKSLLSLVASNDYSNSAFGTSQRVFSVRLNGQFFVTQQWSFETGVSHETTRYLDTFSRQDRFWVGSIGTTYSLTSNASLQLSYVFRKNTSNVPVEFQGSIVSFSASYRF